MVILDSFRMFAWYFMMLSYCGFTIACAGLYEVARNAFASSGVDSVKGKMWMGPVSPFRFRRLAYAADDMCRSADLMSVDSKSNWALDMR